MTTPNVILDAEVEFSTSESSGRTAYIAHHQATGKFFQFGSEEYRIAMLLDGVRDITEIHSLLLEEGIDWDREDVAKLIAELVKSNLAVVGGANSQSASATPTEFALATANNPCIESAPKANAPFASPPAAEPPPSAVGPPPAVGPPHEGLFRRSLAYLPLLISQRIPLFHGDAYAAWLDRRIGRLFDPLGIAIWSMLVSSGLFVVYGHWRAFAAEMRHLFDPQLWPVTVTILILAKILHESGHAATAKHHGIKVGDIGITFFFLAPLAYVDVTDAWRLKNRFSRIQIGLGGVYLELAVAAIVAWTWWLLPDGYAKHLAAQVFLIVGPATLIVNANPLLRLDGYYVVSDLVGIPNLRMHGRRDLGAYLEWLFFAVPRRRSLLIGWQYWFGISHALASVIFQFFWMGGLVIGVAMWDRGVGILLATAALLVWFVLPTVRWLSKIWMLEPGDRFFMNRYRHRLLFYVTLLVAAFPYIAICPSPLDRRVAVIVRFQDEQIARSPSDAFVENVLVQHGEFVEVGKLLVHLSDPDLILRRDKKADDFELARMRAIQSRQKGELSRAAAFAEHAQSLARQLAELDNQVSQLTIYASRDGYILSSRMEYLTGAFVKRGQEILRVSDPREKELLALIPERDIVAYQQASEGNWEANVRLRGGKSIVARPGPLRPRAFQTLAHPAFAATSGGPLAVEPSPDEGNDLRLVNAHLESISKLDPITSAEVRAGQLGKMTLADNRPLLSRIIDSFFAAYR
ncbi:hypothetical protein Q31b_20730 [Novipirellula aureliae]|uniref:Peptidase family M50 n=1 Tax=Novipirellula aureliae TaxID=2527966 RepID=A0A5C6E2E9_9BACT|nr:peptidase M50 [Novipirellula aureliae]TWU43038.1 hypothetical protein Q31b_20730 [Novipirellula aureliae]